MSIHFVLLKRRLTAITHKKYHLEPGGGFCVFPNKTSQILWKNPNFEIQQWEVNSSSDLKHRTIMKILDLLAEMREAADEGVVHDNIFCR